MSRGRIRRFVKGKQALPSLRAKSRVYQSKKKAKRIFLGLDPGLASTGWGLVETSAESPLFKMIELGVIKTQPEEPLSERLLKIHEQIEKLLQKHQPDVVGVENIYFGKNSKTALLVGLAQGVLLLSCGKRRLTLIELTPLQVKISLTGYGRAEKLQVQRMVQKILRLPVLPQPDDASDALAIAITAVYYEKGRGLL